MIIKSLGLLLMIILFLSYLKSSHGNNNSKCSQKTTCSNCIRTPQCVWCKKEVKSTEEFSIRCFEEQFSLEHLCEKKDIVQPKSKIEKQERGRSLGMNSIQPQLAHLSMRVGEKIHLPIMFKQLTDYPIDLYFLMDFSTTMKERRNTISKLAKSLSKEMRKLSNNFHIGFGSFVDKPVKPYSYTSPIKIAQICNSEPVCMNLYTFIHRMKLSNDSELFSTKLKNTPMSTNVDFPEGGFDGLMQAMVCSEQIGWREKARKLLIFVSDGQYHLAGDGKLGGIVEPNDEKCHLTENGRYSYELKQDYPSAYQIQRQAKINNINIIFAITESYVKYYDWFGEEIAGASVVTLSEDSSNIISIIKSHYQEITNSIALTDNAGRSVEIKYHSKCNGNEMKETNVCSIPFGKPVIEFHASITVLECPEDESQWNQKIQIVPGYINESMTIELNIQCKCPCELDKLSEVKSEMCKSNGKLMCGICSCDSGRYGRYCECDGNTAIDTLKETNSCIAPSDTSQVCSGKGDCKCGKCECSLRKKSEEIYYGSFCECNNFSCLRSGNLLCSGSDKGTCDCGQCKCKSGWSGRACECKETNTTCIAPGKQKVCSGNGHCECGVCNCTMTQEFRYSGQFCEECPSCTAERCDELNPCVECTIHKTGDYKESECKMKCQEYQIEEVDFIETSDDKQNTQNKYNMCRLKDKFGCTIVFQYRYKEDNINFEIRGQKEKECIKELNILAIILGVIGSILLAGIILLVIWKFLTTVHDNHEYARFEKESKQAKFDEGENPLYKTPMTTFQNPTFGK